MKASDIVDVTLLPPPIPAEEVWEDVWIPTACDMCYNCCTLNVRRVNGVVVKVVGIPDAPPNHGKICGKEGAAPNNLYNPYRILKPLRRRNSQKSIDVDPQWDEISWDEALDIVSNTKRLAWSAQTWASTIRT